MASIEPDQVYTLEEAAALLKVSRPTMFRLLRQGALPGVKVGKQWRFLGRELLGLFEQGRPKSWRGRRSTGGRR